MSEGYVAHYSGKRRQDWTTPRAMFDALHSEYGFTLDGASEDGNALLPEARTGEDILVSWSGERVFCNPPWRRIREFVELAAFADLAVLSPCPRQLSLVSPGARPRCRG